MKKGYKLLQDLAKKAAADQEENLTIENVAKKYDQQKKKKPKNRNGEYYPANTLKMPDPYPDGLMKLKVEKITGGILKG